MIGNLRGQLSSREAWHNAVQVVLNFLLGEMQALTGLRRSQRDANAFEDRLIALGCNAADRHQHIRLRIVRCGAAPGDRIGNDRETWRHADLSLKVAIDVHNLTGTQIPPLHSFDPATAPRILSRPTSTTSPGMFKDEFAKRSLEAADLEFAGKVALLTGWIRVKLRSVPESRQCSLQIL